MKEEWFAFTLSQTVSAPPKYIRYYKTQTDNISVTRASVLYSKYLSFFYLSVLCVRSSKRLVTLARGLAPAYLRFGGKRTDFLQFNNQKNLAKFRGPGPDYYLKNYEDGDQIWQLFFYLSQIVYFVYFWRSLTGGVGGRPCFSPSGYFWLMHSWHLSAYLVTLYFSQRQFP